MGFRFEPHNLPGLMLITPEIYPDDRGYLWELFTTEAFAEAGIRADFVQDNVSHSRFGVLRGLHFQRPPSAQGKLISVVQGRIWDVVVDLRHGSPTHGQWTAVELDGERHTMFWVPAGFAHGFLVLSEMATVFYKLTCRYTPSHDHGIRWDDTELAISWPIADPVVSPKDQVLPGFATATGLFHYEPTTR